MITKIFKTFKFKDHKSIIKLTNVLEFKELENETIWDENGCLTMTARENLQTQYMRGMTYNGNYTKNY